MRWGGLVLWTGVLLEEGMGQRCLSRQPIHGVEGQDTLKKVYSWEDKGMKEWGRGGEIYIDTLKTIPFHLPPSLRGIFYRLKSSWTIKCLNPVISLVLLSFSTWHLASIIILISIYQFHFSLLDLPHLPTTQFPLLTLTVHFRQQFRERLLYSPSMTNIWRHHLEKVSVDKNIYIILLWHFFLYM